MNKINVLIKRPNKPAMIEEVDNTLDGMRSLIGGYIEALPLANDALLCHIPGICAFCDEEGKLKRLPVNFLIGNIVLGWLDPVCGPVIFAGVNARGECKSITKKQAEQVKYCLAHM